MRQKRPLIFGLIAAVLAIVSSLTPVTSSSFLFKIDSKTTNRIDIPLARHSPDSVKLEILCPTNSIPADNVNLLGTVVRNFQNQGLFVNSTEKGLEVVIGQTRVDSLRCGSLVFKVSKSNTKVINNGRIVDTLDTPVRVSAFVLNQNALDLGYSINAEIAVRGSETSNGLVRWILWIAAIGALICSFVYSRRRQQDKSAPVRKLFTRPDLLDLAFLSIMVFWAIVGPIYLDDGWVTLTSGLPTSWNNFFNVFQTWDARVPIGTPQYLVYNMLTKVSQNLIFLRLVPLLTIFVGWRCIRSILTHLQGIQKKGQSFFAFIVYATFSMSWLMTIRPEPFVSTLSLLSLLYVLRFQRQRNEVDVLIACVFSGISLSIHTSGAVSLTPLIYAALIFLKDQQFDVRSRVTLAIRSASVLVFVGLSAVFIATDVASWRENGRLFENAVNQLGVRDEIQRYRLVISGFPYDSMLRRMYLLLIGLCLAMSILLLVKRRLNLGFLLIVGPILFLLITPTKWPWHFGSTVGLVSVSLLLVLSETSDFKVSSILGASLFSYVAMFFITKSPEGWGFFFPSSQKSGLFGQFENAVKNPNTGILIILLLVGFSAVFPLKTLRRNVPALIVLTPLVLAALLPLSFGLRDFGTQTSLASMNSRSLLRPSTCGIGSKILTPDLSTIVPLEEVSQLKTYESRTPGGRLERYISPSVDSDSLVGPWIRLPTTTDYVIVPISGDITDTSRLEIQFAPEVTNDFSFSDTTIRQSFLEGSRITLGPLNAPPDSNFFRIRVRNSVNNKLGIPQAIHIKSLVELSKEGRKAQVDPYFKPLLPCMGERAASKGLALVPDFMVGDNPLLATSPANILVDSHDLVFSRGYINEGTVFSLTWVLPIGRFDETDATSEKWKQ